MTQRIVVIPYRRFGTTYRSHLQRRRVCEWCASSGPYVLLRNNCLLHGFPNLRNLSRDAVGYQTIFTCYVEINAQCGGHFGRMVSSTKVLALFKLE